MVNGGLVMPIAPAARLKRAKTCSNCAAHGLPPNYGPGAPLLECRLDPPQMILAPMGNGQVRPTSIFKAVEPDWWCLKWQANVQIATSLDEATAHVSNDT